MINKFWWIFGIQIFFFFLEISGGILFGSLALISDAAHIFSDLFAITISFAALALAQKKLPTARMSFGYHRLEVFSAIFNGITLIILAMFILFAAWHRFQNPQVVDALPALGIGFFGFIGNLAAAYILKLGKQHKKDINIKAVYWHLLGDMLASVGVIFGMIAIYFTGLYVIDALISMGIAVLLIVNAGKVVVEGAGILLQQSPHDLDEVREKARTIPHVIDIEDFRLWQVCSHLLIGTAHVVTDLKKIDQTEAVGEKIKKLLEKEFNIRHLTLQFETPAMATGHRHELNHKH